MNRPAGKVKGGPAAGQAGARACYKRILLKLSGESLMGDRGYGIDPATVEFMAAEIKKVADMGIQVAVV
ncbi:MAG: hypothetical protein M1510_05835, partial [Nitrospirae bacterium]|nr:hypothetical protein [Nitrospirota bacterium]